MKNYFYLNLNIPLFNEGITINDLPKKSIAIVEKEKYLNKEIFNFFDSLNLKIFFVETFFKRPGDPEIIHIDAMGGDYTKLNWVFGGGNSKMCWYEPIDKSYKPIFRTPTNTPYIAYQIHEVIEIDKTIIKNPTIVQVGIPHNIVDVTEDRFCVSIFFQDKDSSKRLSIEESITRFSQYIGSE